MGQIKEFFFQDDARTASDKKRSLQQVISGIAQNLKILRIERIDQEDRRGWQVITQEGGDDPGY